MCGWSYRFKTGNEVNAPPGLNRRPRRDLRGGRELGGAAAIASGCHTLTEFEGVVPPARERDGIGTDLLACLPHRDDHIHRRSDGGAGVHQSHGGDEVVGVIKGQDEARAEGSERDRRFLIGTARSALAEHSQSTDVAGGGEFGPASARAVSRRRRFQ